MYIYVYHSKIFYFQLKYLIVDYNCLKATQYNYTELLLLYCKLNPYAYLNHIKIKNLRVLYIYMYYIYAMLYFSLESNIKL